VAYLFAEVAARREILIPRHGTRSLQQCDAEASNK
jgi:hypothetical protein